MRSLGALVVIAALASCKACVTLDRPLSFPCNPDASVPVEECPTGFRCGLEGRCHELDAGAPYECREDSDCEGAWRCGLEHVCHERDAGTDYLCTSDEQCEARWRCGPQGRCLDSTHDALELPDGFPLPDVRPLFPNLPSGNAAAGGSLQVQVQVTSNAGCQLYFEARSFSWEHDGMLVKHVDFPNGVAALPPGTPAGPECLAIESSKVAQRTVESATPLPAPVAALSDEGVETVALLTDGQLCRFALDATYLSAEAIKCRTVFSGGQPSHLKGTAVEGSGSGVPGYVAWNTSQLWWLESFDAPAEGPFAVPDGIVLDALAITRGRDPGLLAITRDNLFIARVSMGTLTSPDGGTGTFGVAPWFARQMPNPERALNQRGSYVFLTNGSASFVAESSASANDLVLDFGGAEPKWYLSFTEALYTCAVEPNTGLSLAPSTGSQRVGVVSRCVPDGGTVIGKNQALATSGWSFQTHQPVGVPIDNFSMTASSPNAWFFSTPARAGLGNPGGTVWSDTLGHVWSVDDELQVVNALVPDRQLSWVGGDSTAVKLGIPAINWAQEKSGELGTGFLNSGSWKVLADGGFEQGFHSGALMFVGAVRGLADGDVLKLPHGIFSRDVIVAGVSGVARGYAASNDDDTVRSPLDIELLTRGASRYLLWRSFDSVWLVTIDDSSDAGFNLTGFESLPEPVRRMTPLVNQAITSLAWTTGGGMGHFLDGYMVAGARLFSFTALNERVWRNEEVLVGADEPAEVFFDRGRARVGLRDGSLWSLPSRVQLSEPFPSTEGLAEGFANVCGQTLALSDRHLMRLEWDESDQTGTWTPLALPPEVAAASSQPAAGVFARSRLFTVDRDVLLAHDTGVVFRLTFSGACP